MYIDVIKSSFLLKTLFIVIFASNIYNKKDINVLIIELSISTSESHLSSTYLIFKSKSFVIKETNDLSNIIYLISIDRLITKYIFRGFHYMIVII